MGHDIKITINGKDRVTTFDVSPGDGLEGLLMDGGSLACYDVTIFDLVDLLKRCADGKCHVKTLADGEKIYAQIKED